MATRTVKGKDGKDYSVGADRTTGGKYLSLITPPGRYVREPDSQTTDNAGVATKHPGRVVEFDTEDGALDAGEQNVKLGMV